MHTNTNEQTEQRAHIRDTRGCRHDSALGRVVPSSVVSGRTARIPHRTHAPHDTKTHSSKRTSHRIVRPGREDPRATDIMCSHAERRTQTDRGDRRTVVARFQFVPVAPLVSHHALTTLSRQVRSGPFRPDRKIVSACTSAGGVCATAPSPCRCTRAAPPAREEQTDERDHSPAQHTYSPRRLRSPAKASGAPRAAAQPSWLVTAISCGQYPCCG